MKRDFLTMSFLLLTVMLFSQNFVTKIKIKKTKWNVLISPADSVLWINKENQVEINVEGGDNYYVGIKGGTLKYYKSKYWLLVPTEGAATLTVYEKLPNKKNKPVYTKLYQIKRIPEPVPYVCGVKGDSVIDKLQIINDNEITALHPSNKQKFAIANFDLIVTIGGKTDTLHSPNSHFTIEMRKRIYYLESGSILYFENVYCAMPDGKLQKLKPFEIFINETNKYKVGYRGKGM